MNSLATTKTRSACQEQNRQNLNRQSADINNTEKLVVFQTIKW